MISATTTPQSIGKTLDMGFKLYVSVFKNVFLLCFLGMSIMSLPSVFMVFSGIEPGGVPEGMLLIISIAIFLACVAFGCLFLLAILIKYAATAKGESIAMTDSIKKGLGYIFPMIGIWFLYSIAIVVGMLLLVIPGIYLMVALMLAPYLIIIEDNGVWASLKRSRQLIKGNWWRTTIIITVPVVIQMALALGIQVPLSIMAATMQGNQIVAIFIELGSNILLNSITIPLTYAVMIVLYYDLKIRKEGDDLAARIDNATVEA